VCVDRRTLSPGDAHRARLANCGALGGADVNSDVDPTEPKTMSTLPAKKPSALKNAASKKGNAKTRSTSQRHTLSAVTLALAPTQVDEPQVDRVTKQERMLALLSRAEGASIAEMMQATHWQQHSVRGFLAGTVKKKLGFSLSSSKAADDVRRYRIKTRRGS
jgi:hypothetical protein